jgi:hypothetical protein
MLQNLSTIVLQGCIFACLVEAIVPLKLDLMHPTLDTFSMRSHAQVFGT